MSLAIPYGVAATSALRSSGVSRKELARLLESEQLHRIRRGWYATPNANRQVVRAIQCGGRVSCVSALGLHGLWMPPGKELHVRLPERALSDHRAMPRGAQRCTARGPHAKIGGPDPVDPFPLALTAAANCLTAEHFVAVLDSARRQHQLTPSHFHQMLAPCSHRVHSLVDRTDIADSGTESLVRYRLRSLGVKLTPQVQIADVGRVDFVVGERMVIEVDSLAHHTSLDAYHQDRLRDRTLQTMGYLVIRLTYHQVMNAWEPALADIMTLIRRRHHLRWPTECRPM